MKKNQHPQTQPPLGLALVVYALFVIGVITLLPFRFHWPSRIVVTLRGSAFDGIMNIVLFLPFGFLYQLTRGQRSDWRCLKALALGLFISFCIEFAQLFQAGRYSSLIDLLANGAGGWIGALIHNHVRQKLNDRLIGQLALELPLTTLFYLVSPLLWLNGLATGENLSRLCLAPILGMFGAALLVSIWKHRLKPAGIFSANTLSLLVGMWFLLVSLPGLTKQPVWIVSCSLGIVVFVRVLASFPVSSRDTNRRFELPTLKWIWPLYFIYLCLLALWPWTQATHSWNASIGFAELANAPGIIPTLRMLEYVSAFTLFGYMIAESRGRKEEPFLIGVIWLFLCCLTCSGLLELIRGTRQTHLASLAQIILATGAGVYGGIIYRLQLASVRQLLSKSVATQDDSTSV